MARFVQLADVVAEMAKHAPPTWCKFAVLGALHTERCALYSCRGKIRGYVPPYHLVPADGQRHSMLNNSENSEEFLARHELKGISLPNSEAVEIWRDEWSEEPRRIAIGWFLFSAPWDWDAPFMEFDYFAIPGNYESIFSYDDIHPHGEADSALFYEGHFDRLALSIDDAESLVPMANFNGCSFGSKSSAPTRNIGRPPGSGFHKDDEPLIQQMLSDLRANPDASARSLAEKYADQAVGFGVRESIVKRLERRLTGPHRVVRDIC